MGTAHLPAILRPCGPGNPKETAVLGRKVILKNNNKKNLSLQESWTAPQGSSGLVALSDQSVGRCFQKGPHVNRLSPMGPLLPPQSQDQRFRHSGSAAPQEWLVTCDQGLIGTDGHVCVLPGTAPQKLHSDTLLSGGGQWMSPECPGWVSSQAKNFQSLAKARSQRYPQVTGVPWPLQPREAEDGL